MPRAHRLAPVVAAKRASAQAQLAACLARQAHLRAQAADLLRTARSAPPGDDAADMALTARWQDTLRRAALSLRSEAAGLDRDAAAFRAVLARALGREQAVNTLVKSERRQALRHAERRAEDRVCPAGDFRAALTGADVNPGD